MQEIIGYFWQNDESTTCEKCGLGMIRSAILPTRSVDVPGSPTAIREGELCYEDNVRCDACGERLVDPPPPPKSFEQVWADRQRRRREAAVDRRAAAE